ncbi:MAG: CHAT domain-containing protein [Planctomycetaceae bacterium]|nr:CHAT domain-containing protein [Planctomycetaceae bacterium]
MLTLKIRQRDNQLAASLYQDGELLGEQIMRMDRDKLLALGGQLRRLLGLGWQHRGGNAVDHAELQRLGQELGQLFAGCLRAERLEDSAEELLSLDLPMELLGVPWELAVVHGRTLNQAFAIGRIVSDLGPTSPSISREVHNPTTHFRIWANPTFDLIHAEDEATIVEKALRQLPSASVQSCSRSKDIPSLLSELSSADCFHFAGHADEIDGDRCWRLLDGELTPQRLLDSQLPVPRFLFAHACGSAQINIENPENSLVLVFLRRGLGNYLGLWTPSLDRHAAEFAQVFYAELFAGTSIGSVLFRTRRRLSAEFGWGELLLGNYLLYGDPAQIPVPAHQTSSNPLNQETANQHKRDPRQLTYPVNCVTCGRQLNSHFLVGSIAVVESGVRVECRHCEVHQKALAPNSLLPPPVSIHNALIPTAASLYSLDTTQSARLPAASQVHSQTAPTPIVQKPPSPETLPDGWRYLQENLRKTPTLQDPATGLRFKALWKMTTSQLGSVDYQLESAPSATEFPILTWQLSLRFIHFDELDAENIMERLKDCFQELQRANRAEQVCVVFVSDGTWPHSISAELPTWLADFEGKSSQLSCVLLDLQAEHPISVATTSATCEIVKCLDWESDVARLRRALRGIEQFRPLEVSVSAQSLADRLQIPLDTVEQACRILTQQHRTLHFDEVPPFGWVLSESFE